MQMGWKWRTNPASRLQAHVWTFGVRRSVMSSLPEDPVRLLPTAGCHSIRDTPPPPPIPTPLLSVFQHILSSETVNLVKSPLPDSKEAFFPTS